MTTSSQMISALLTRFEPRSWAFLEQVRNGTGYARAPRTADAIAVSLWPSRGLEIHGIEIKVSHGDFVRELAEPEKADAVQRYCHRWWVAAPDEKVAPPADLPPNWGLLVLKGKGIAVAKDAPLLTPRAPDLLFLASVLRQAARAQQAVAQRARQEALRGDGSGRDDPLIVQRARQETEMVRSQLQQLQSRVAEFEQASGVQIARGWDLPSVGRAVDLVRGWFGRQQSPTDLVQGLINTMQVEIRKLEDAKAEAAEFERQTGGQFRHDMPGNKNKERGAA